MTLPLHDKKERAIVMACIYLAALFTACIIMWWTVFIGGNPLEFERSEMFDINGKLVTELKAGDVIGVHRHICSNQAIGIQFFPSLRDQRDQMFTLPPGIYDIPKGCVERAYGFVVPDIPPGEYTYQSAVSFQSSMVGRDETIMMPSIKVRIIK